MAPLNSVNLYLLAKCQVEMNCLFDAKQNFCRSLHKMPFLRAAWVELLALLDAEEIGVLEK
jgi:hypothetical protein